MIAAGTSKPALFDAVIVHSFIVVKVLEPVWTTTNETTHQVRGQIPSFETRFIPKGDVAL